MSISIMLLSAPFIVLFVSFLEAYLKWKYGFMFKISIITDNATFWDWVKFYLKANSWEMALIVTGLLMGYSMGVG